MARFSLDELLPPPFQPAPWYKEVVLTGATAATSLELVADSEVATGKKVVLQGWKVITSAGVWGTNANELFFRSNDNSITQLNLPIGQFFTSSAFFEWSDSDQQFISLEYNLTKHGGPNGNGLKVLADANETGAADLEIAGWGMIVDF